MLAARFRFACLWLSQSARVLADTTLLLVVLLALAQAGAKPARLCSLLPSLLLPTLLLAPIIGALSNAWPRGKVLTYSTLFCLLSVGVFALPEAAQDAESWLVALRVALLGTAVFGPTSAAILPVVSLETQWPLSRITGWVGTGGAAAIVLGLWLGAEFSNQPAVLFVVAGIDTLALLAILPVDFPCDIRRREPPGQAIAGFFRDARRVYRDVEARACLLGLAGFLALVVGAVAPLPARVEIISFLVAGAAVGFLIASLQGHPRRTVGLVPFGATGIVFALAWFAVSDSLNAPGLLVGFTSGLVLAPLQARYLRVVPADARGNAMALSSAVNALFCVGLLLLLFNLERRNLLGPAGNLWLLVVLAALLACAAWAALFQQAFEQVLEIVFWPVYRVYGHGPGLALIPDKGPMLVIANHTAWFDPMWVGKVFPRRLFPMMTSDFYDAPGVHFIFRHVFEAIRVQASVYRREAPEIADAVRHLDRGHAVALWPEGWLRRRPEPSLRMFGQGVWHILRERPDTPVVVCWVEGGYGSFTSYFKGRPTKNKRPDFWRRIDVAVAEPQVLPADVLADTRATRIYLMRECLKARGLLGLEVPPLSDLGEDEEEKKPQRADE